MGGGRGSVRASLCAATVATKVYPNDAARVGPLDWQGTANRRGIFWAAFGAGMGNAVWTGTRGVQMRKLGLVPLLLVTALLFGSCATFQGLARLVQPPQFRQANDRAAEIRLLPPGANLPAGGAALRVWTSVTNPNPFGVVLSELKATLMLEGGRAITGDFPLGLPLSAGEESVIPLDLSVSFADLPGVARVVQRAAGGQPVEYRVDGTVGVAAEVVGHQTFGPMTLFSGELAVPAGSTSR
jgi:hypothetical protein